MGDGGQADPSGLRPTFIVEILWPGKVEKLMPTHDEG